MPIPITTNTSPLAHSHPHSFELAALRDSRVSVTTYLLLTLVIALIAQVLYQRRAIRGQIAEIDELRLVTPREDSPKYLFAPNPVCPPVTQKSGTFTTSVKRNMKLQDAVQRVVKEFEYGPEDVQRGVKEFLKEMGMHRSK